MRELTVVIPTLNERDNVVSLVDKIDRCLEGVVDWEIIFVDDASTDGTIDELIRLNQTNPRVRFIERVGRRGLSSACIEGFLSTSAPLLAVMDADHQHDETILAKMVETMRGDPSLDLVIGSRFVEGGGVGDWNRFRLALSRLGKWVSNLILPDSVSDPMSGFFMVRRPFVWDMAPKLSGRGFKILADILACSRGRCRFAEVPFEFGLRHSGSSKLGLLVGTEFLALVADHLLGGWLPLRFLKFVLVGFLGMLVHLAVLGSLVAGLGIVFWAGQMTAAFAAMTFNFALNNSFTYRDRKLRGIRFVGGMLRFYLFCGAGFLINMAVALEVYSTQENWLLAGVLGGITGAVWNYATNSVLTWRSA